MITGMMEYISDWTLKNNPCKTLWIKTYYNWWRHSFYLHYSGLLTNKSLTHWGRDKMADIFKCIFVKENVWISNTIWLKFVPNGPIDNDTLVQIMAWRRTSAEPLSEPIMARLVTHISFGLLLDSPWWRAVVCFSSSMILDRVITRPEAPITNMN